MDGTESVDYYSSLLSEFGEQGLFIDCPHCHSQHAHYVVDHQDVMLRCMCGYAKVVATRLQEMVIEHIDSGSMVTTPKPGTMLDLAFRTLVVLVTATTQEITQSVNAGGKEQTSSEVASQLTVLRYKGLVDKLEDKRGFVGGSTWHLTTAAKKLVGVIEKV